MKSIAKALPQVERGISAGPFAPTWESLLKYQVPDWFQDAKFGIFIHWGVYSVPAFDSEWYPRHMYTQGHKVFDHHVKTYGPQSQFGYKDFIPLFKARRFDADRWARLFKKAGARYVIPVAEHHDGFAMYDCSFSKWTATKMGPKRDLIGELAAAIRRQGLIFGLSNHRIEHWYFMDEGRKFDSDIRSGRWDDFYGPAQPKDSPMDPPLGSQWLDEWLVRCCELVDKYQPQLFYFDWWINYHMAKAHLRKFAAYYYNRGAATNQGVVLNYKDDAFPPGAAVIDFERGIAPDVRPMYWQTDTAVGKQSWSHVQDMEYKAPGELIGDLVDIVSKNGNLLLNIGPRADGSIPDEDEGILLAIGDWLRVNGEAIYDSRPWKVYGEGPTRPAAGMFSESQRATYTGQDIRFTTKGANTLYALCLDWPGKDLTIHSLGANVRLFPGAIEDVQLLGASAPLKWVREAGGLRVTLPARKPCKHAFAFKITGLH
jgi:alpha-L-fucosidase